MAYYMNRFTKSVTHRLGEPKGNRHCVQQIQFEMKTIEAIKQCTEDMKTENEKFIELLRNYNYSADDLCIWW
jgi:hypothetical protein